MPYANLAQMHRLAAERGGSKTALRYCRGGAWRDLSWIEYRDRVERAAAGLIALGIRPGDRVAILAENCPEWLIADIAILACGAVNVPLHAPLATKQAEYQLGHSGARAIFVGGQDQADKVYAIGGDLPALECLIAFDAVAGGSPRSVKWQDLVATPVGAAARDELLSRESALGPSDLATIIYTSGTTGNPKGVMLTHGNLCSNAEGTLAVADTGPDDILLSWLPYSHIYARTVDHYSNIAAGATVCLAQSQETLLADLAAVQPTWVTSVPRFYEKVWAAVGPLPEAARGAALRGIFGPRIRQLSSGGAPLPKHIGIGITAAGIPLLEGYGLTESSPVISFNRLSANKLGTVGRPIPGVEVRIADDGEILTKGPHVMPGYWNDPEATAAAIQDGWLHTGDVGTIDSDGFLAITDRKKDLIITSGGKNIAPTELERLLLCDPYIDQAVVYGDARPFVAALIVPNFERLNAKAAELGCSLATEGDLLRSPPVEAFLAERIETLMQQVSQPERVKKFLLLATPFSVAADELTVSLKLRRRHILAKHADKLNALYGSDL